MYRHFDIDSGHETIVLHKVPSEQTGHFKKSGCIQPTSPRPTRTASLKGIYPRPWLSLPCQPKRCNIEARILSSPHFATNPEVSARPTTPFGNYSSTTRTLLWPSTSSRICTATTTPRPTSSTLASFRRHRWFNRASTIAFLHLQQSRYPSR